MLTKATLSVDEIKVTLWSESFNAEHSAYPYQAMLSATADVEHSQHSHEAAFPFIPYRSFDDDGTLVLVLDRNGFVGSGAAKLRAALSFTKAFLRFMRGPDVLDSHN